MHPDFIFIKETSSTNDLLKQKLKDTVLPEFQVIWTDFQSSGKGQTGNSWESGKGKNLLFSILFYPKHIPIEEHFIVSQIVSISVVDVLNEITPGFRVKWPNDIYFGEKKIAGILIENTLQGNLIKNMVVGIGVNINQKIFISNAPNPISLLQITGKIFNKKLILDQITDKIIYHYTESNFKTIRKLYFSLLYRKEGFFTYRADNQIFNASIRNIYPDGQLELLMETGEIKKFYFKEVEFVI
jgi:BirA family transcriptional regulator, biotin operon repressor / biotin---[acetyl-CoA-carboxylase] ligase